MDDCVVHPTLPHGHACTCLLVTALYLGRARTVEDVLSFPSSAESPAPTWHVVPHEPFAFPSAPFSRILRTLRREMQPDYVRIAADVNPRVCERGGKTSRLVVEVEMVKELSRGEAVDELLRHLRWRFGPGDRGRHKVLAVWETIALTRGNDLPGFRGRYEVDICAWASESIVGQLSGSRDGVALLSPRRRSHLPAKPIEFSPIPRAVSTPSLFSRIGPRKNANGYAAPTAVTPPRASLRPYPKQRKYDRAEPMALNLLPPLPSYSLPRKREHAARAIVMDLSPSSSLPYAEPSVMNLSPPSAPPRYEPRKYEHTEPVVRNLPPPSLPPYHESRKDEPTQSMTVKMPSTLLSPYHEPYNDEPTKPTTVTMPSTSLPPNPGSCKDRLANPVTISMPPPQLHPHLNTRNDTDEHTEPDALNLSRTSLPPYPNKMRSWGAPLSPKPVDPAPIRKHADVKKTTSQNSYDREWDRDRDRDRSRDRDRKRRSPPRGFPSRRTSYHSKSSHVSKHYSKKHERGRSPKDSQRGSSVDRAHGTSRHSHISRRSNRSRSANNQRRTPRKNTPLLTPPRSRRGTISSLPLLDNLSANAQSGSFTSEAIKSEAMDGQVELSSSSISLSRKPLPPGLIGPMSSEGPAAESHRKIVLHVDVSEMLGQLDQAQYFAGRQSSVSIIQAVRDMLTSIGLVGKYDLMEDGFVFKRSGFLFSTIHPRHQFLITIPNEKDYQSVHELLTAKLPTSMELASLCPVEILPAETQVASVVPSSSDMPIVQKQPRKRSAQEAFTQQDTVRDQVPKRRWFPSILQ